MLSYRRKYPKMNIVRRLKSQTSFLCPDLMKTGYCQKHEPIGAGTVLIKLENKTFVGWTGKYSGVSRDGYYQDTYETYIYVDHVGKGDVIQSYPVVMEEASGKAPPSSKMFASFWKPAGTNLFQNHDAFEDFIYNIPKDMDLRHENKLGRPWHNERLVAGSRTLQNGCGSK